MPSRSTAVRDMALEIGAGLAQLETTIGALGGMVMNAAITGQSGALDRAEQAAGMLDDQATALYQEIRRMRKAMRS